jgi:uncharacterized protein
MALVTVDTLNGAAIEDFTGDLFRKWGIGKKGQDNGIMYLLAIKDHKQRIEVGYGLEPILPDGFVGGVQRQVQPLLRQSAYGAAILTAAELMGGTIAKAKGIELDTHLVQPQQPRMSYRQSRGRGLPWPIILIGIVVLLAALSRMGGGGVGRYGGGGGSGVGGFLAGMFLGNLLGGGGRGERWGGGGGFGGGDSGSGGFGGFGGGDSGGGGASSDW